MAFITKIDMGAIPINRIPSRVNDVKEYFKALGEQLTDVRPGLIVDDICNAGVEKAIELNILSPKTGVAENDIYKMPTSDGRSAIIMQGENAVYDEFGTGEEGMHDPHPLKNQFPLNPYNSGPFIFYNEFTGRYQWRYRPMAGKPYFTETGLTSGTPSGKQMFNTLQYVYSMKGDIVYENIQQALKESIRK